MDGSSYHLSPSGSPHSNTNSGAIPRRNTTDASPKVQDRFLPIANVGRIMKKSLPANAKISKEAKETVQECVSEFIGFVTGEASDKCRREKRKTINGEDLLWAMTTLGFEGYAVHLGVFLDKCREADGEKSPMAMQGDHDQSPMEEKARDGSAKQGLLDDVYSIPENMAVNLDIPSTSPEFYSLDTRTMAQGFVGGGMGKGYGQTDSIFGNYTMNLREDNGIGDANGATAWAAHHHHGVQYWF